MIELESLFWMYVMEMIQSNIDRVLRGKADVIHDGPDPITARPVGVVGEAVEKDLARPRGLHGIGGRLVAGTDRDPVPGKGRD